MSYSSFHKGRAIRIDVKGIRRRYVDLAVVDILVTFMFEPLRGDYVDLVKTRYYNSFFPHQKVRMETNILSGKLDGDISQPFAVWSLLALRASRSP